MSDRPTIQFCCSYYHDGAWWALTIAAYDWSDAEARCKKLGLKLDGELMATVPRMFGFGKLIAWAITGWKNLFRWLPILLLLTGCSTCDSLFCFGEKARRADNQRRFEEMMTDEEMDKVSERVVELKQQLNVPEK